MRGGEFVMNIISSVNLNPVVSVTTILNAYLVFSSKSCLSPGITRLGLLMSVIILSSRFGTIFQSFLLDNSRFSNSQSYLMILSQSGPEHEDFKVNR